MKDIAECLRLAANKVQATRNAGAGDLAELLEEGAKEIDELRALIEVYKNEK